MEFPQAHAVTKRKILLLTVAILIARGSFADQLVTLCSKDDQAGAGVNLATALAAGGRIVFLCGAHATIQITRTHAIGQTTEVDGNDSIVLDAGGAHSVFTMSDSAATLRLRNLTIRGARPTGPTPFGSVFEGPGTLELVHSRIESSLNAIDTLTVRVSDSEIVDNLGTVFSAQNLELTRTRIHGSGAHPIRSSGGSVIIRDSDLYGSQSSSFFDCQLRIERSRFTANDDLTGDGGAIHTTCDTTILESSFVNNRAHSGGAIFVRNTGRLVVQGSHFNGNEAQEIGGAIAVGTPWTPSRVFTLRHVTFADNRAKSGGAIHLGTAIENETTLEGTAISFERNTAAETGGAVAGTNASLRLARAVFIGNRAGQHGGAIELSHFAPRSVILANALLVRNAAPTGSVYRGSAIRFLNSTIADNQGLALLLFWPTSSVANPPDWRRVQLVNTLFSGNPGGGCSGGPFRVLLNDGGGNMQFPGADCGASIPVADPRLDNFYVPLPTGPAIGKGDLATCRTAPVNGVDVYGQRRPQGAGCTIGAVEGDIEDLIARRLRGREQRTQPGRPQPPRDRPPSGISPSSSSPER